MHNPRPHCNSSHHTNHLGRLLDWIMLHAAVYHFDSDVQSLPVWGAAIFEALGSLVGAPLVITRHVVSSVASVVRACRFLLRFPMFGLCSLSSGDW